ncbi:MAG: hypothetical protein RIE23_07780 [Pontimonas sp.]
MTIGSAQVIDRALVSVALTITMGIFASVLAIGAWFAPYPVFLLLPVMAAGIGLACLTRARYLAGGHRLPGFVGGGLSIGVAATLALYLFSAPYTMNTVQATGEALVQAIQAEDHEALQQIVPTYTGTAEERARTASLRENVEGYTLAVVANAADACAVMTLDGLPLFELWMMKITPSVDNRMQAYEILAVLTPKTETRRSVFDLRGPETSAQAAAELLRESRGGMCRVALEQAANH